MQVKPLQIPKLEESFGLVMFEEIKVTTPSFKAETSMSESTMQEPRNTGNLVKL